MFGEEKYKSKEKLELKEIKKEFPKFFKEICCPSCSNTVPVENLNINDKIAKCKECNAIFSFEEEISSSNKEGKIKQEFLRPEGIELFYLNDELEITVQNQVKGLDAIGIGLTPFFAILSIGIYLYGETNTSPIFPIAFSLVGLYFIYRVLFHRNYKTYIHITNNSLSLKSPQNHSQKKKTFQADKIDQVYVKKSKKRYSVYMIINEQKGQKHQKLLTVDTIAKAKFLEQEIEDYLYIEDRKVPEASA